MSGIPGSTEVQTVTVAGGAAAWATIGVPYRGNVANVVLVQTAGTLEGCDLNLYCARIAMDEPGETAHEIYRIDPTADLFKLTLPAAASVFSMPGIPVGMAYQNMDAAGAINEGFLYAKLSPGGSGSKTFKLRLLVESPYV